MRRPVGVKSILFSLRETTFFSLPSGHCRHASIRTLEERIISLGACWAFSFQPVLPSDYRPVVLLFESRTRRLTQSPELGFRVLSVLFPERFCFYAAVATVVLPLLCDRSYTSTSTCRHPRRCPYPYSRDDRQWQILSPQVSGPDPATKANGIVAARLSCRVENDSPSGKNALPLLLLFCSVFVTRKRIKT
jgi:hypothetical protein